MGKEQEYLSVGKIVGAHGVSGNLKVFSSSGDPEEFKAGLHLLVRSVDGQTHTCIVRWCQPHGRHFLLSFEGISSRNHAESLVGSELFALRSDLPALEEDTYYWEDIIGLAVYTIEGAFVGHVKTIIPTGSNDVYEVVDESSGSERLVPALHSVVKSIDLDKGVIHVDLPDEL
ncbi:MAG: ribosome maturation factor RimM [Thermodesulfobacteriota bacterium]|nr:ribosome maturation factor RimM [Thermodesulfobacteriota bacterium]